MSYLVIFICLVFTIFLYRKWNHGLSPIYFWGTYVAKIGAGIAFWYIYTFIYGEGNLTGDSGCYFREGQIINDIIWSRPFDFIHMAFGTERGQELIALEFQNTPYARYAENSSQFIPTTKSIIHFNSLFLFFTANELLGMFALFIQFGFLGVLYTWKELRRNHSFKSFHILLFLAPSILLWTSSNLKESIAIWGIALLYLAWNSSCKRGLHLVIGLLLIVFLKPYWLIFLAVSFLLSIIIMSILKGSIIQKLIAISLVTLPFFFSSYQHATQLISDKQFDFINLAEGGIYLTDSSKYIYLPLENKHLIEKVSINQYVINQDTDVEIRAFSKVRKTWKSHIEAFEDTLYLSYTVRGGNSFMPITRIDRDWKNLIPAFASGASNIWIRWPAQSSSMNWIHLLAYLEQLVFLGILIWIIFKHYNKRQLDFYLPWWLFIILTSLIIGAITPVYGAIVRYRIPMQFVLILLFLRLYIKPYNK